MFYPNSGVRPFGVSLLIAGFDDNEPYLYQWFFSFSTCKYTDDMELDDAVHTAILTLKEGIEGQISKKNIEIGIIGSDKTFWWKSLSEFLENTNVSYYKKIRVSGSSTAVSLPLPPPLYLLSLRMKTMMMMGDKDDTEDYS
ncbi:proteasome subunit alpha type-2-like [Arachis stenosperma]|uniref:proteasome subunit alpha type-2-like n=1 Tax=Arachis stenosperma TaxID=217475 RepID=UPI0025AD4DC6|nr:proteasome subunit alpha type-2-like [Arachis stenosperma]